MFLHIPEWITEVNDLNKATIKTCIKELTQQVKSMSKLPSDSEDLAQVYVWQKVKHKEDLPLFVLATGASSQSSEISNLSHTELVKHAFPHEELEQIPQKLDQTEEYPLLATLTPPKQKFKPKMKKKKNTC